MTSQSEVVVLDALGVVLPIFQIRAERILELYLRQSSFTEFVLQIVSKHLLLIFIKLRYSGRYKLTMSNQIQFN